MATVGYDDPTMDDIDTRIVDLLQRDARYTQAQVARQVGLSQPSVAERIRKLEEQGIITGYVALVDPRKLGCDITAFIGVNVEHPKHFEDFALVVRALDEVLECHRVAGRQSYLLKVRTANTETLDRLLVEQIRTLPGVARTETTIVLHSVKEGARVALTGRSNGSSELGKMQAS